MTDQQIAEKASESIGFLAWDVDEYVKPDFGDEEQQATFEKMYNELYENLDNLLNRFKELANIKETK